MAEYALVVHGGAWNIPDSLWPDHQRGCDAAHRIGSQVLEAGGSAIDAVCAAIRSMEDDPIFDAGTGSFLDYEGRIGLDAGLMEGRELRGGGVLGVSRVRHPIDLARLVLTETEHCLFSGEGAHQLAAAAGLEMVDETFHVIERERALFERIRGGDRRPLDEAWQEPGHDTVGAIALDRDGNLAAGNSTGGTLYRMPGRIGDAALIGVGFYADNQVGAVVCTGWGESIMRSAMAMHGLGRIQNAGPQNAAEDAVAHLESRVAGRGGILAMAPDGRVGVAFNTQRMAFSHTGAVSSGQ